MSHIRAVMQVHQCQSMSILSGLKRMITRGDPIEH